MPPSPAATNRSPNPGRPPKPIPIPDQPSRLFALLIGIDRYQSPTHPTLKGAVNDANAVKEYLKTHLNVSSSRIRNLRNERATRIEIIKAFHALREDDNIKRGDPILIFYAGHGGETDAPLGWEAGGPNAKIQTLVPYDCSTKADGCEFHLASAPIGKGSRKIQGRTRVCRCSVPDRTIGALLDRLAREKGDNITVVFDCCHSGSGTRTENGHTRLFRVAEVPPVIAQLDQEILLENGRGDAIPTGFAHAGTRSHVLLAACGAAEKAAEDNGRGVFTKAFLETLSIVGADKITYTDFLHRMHALPKQNPQCEGYNRDRILFNSKVQSPGRVLYTVSWEGDKCVMDAGAAHGITDGAEFAVYSNKDWPPTTSPLGPLVASKTRAFSAILDVPTGTSRIALAQSTFALQTKAGTEEDLRLHIATDKALRPIFKALITELKNRGPRKRTISLVKKEKAELDISLVNGAVVFNILNSLVTQFGLLHMPSSVSPSVDDVHPIIRAAAHYHWHLRRSNEGPLRDLVDIEFTKLKHIKDKWEDDLSPKIEPVGPNLNLDGVVDLVVDDSMYGMKIINRSNVSLYPSLFYFDNSNFSITSYYEPSTAGQGKLDAPLKGKGSLTIGYGSGGASPRCYFLRQGQNVDVGFLKLFLATQPVQLTDVPQLSPFKKDNKGPPVGGCLRSSEPVAIETFSTWDTILVTIVQRRVPKKN